MPNEKCQISRVFQDTSQSRYREARGVSPCGDMSPRLLCLGCHVLTLSRLERSSMRRVVVLGRLGRPYQNRIRIPQPSILDIGNAPARPAPVTTRGYERTITFRWSFGNCNVNDGSCNIYPCHFGLNMTRVQISCTQSTLHPHRQVGRRDFWGGRGDSARPNNRSDLCR